MNKYTRPNTVSVALTTVMTMTLCGGCTPVGGGEIETFLKEVLLSAAAAFLF